MNSLDTTLESVVNTRFRNTYHDLIRQLAKQTQFNEIEVSSILMIYYKHVLVNGPKANSMARKQFFHLFLVIFRIYDLFIIDRILNLINIEQKKEVDPVAWVKLFSVFMSNNMEQKMKFAFQVYNIQGTGYLNRELVTNAVKKFFLEDDEDELVELRSDMVEVIMKKFDVDRDGQISYEDFAQTVINQPLLIEFLGNCLPSNTGTSVIAYCANIMSQIEGNKFEGTGN